MPMKGKVIWGCGGHGREVLWLCEQIGLPVVGFLDERRQVKGTRVNDVPVLGDISDITHLRDDVEVICAGVGCPRLKKRFLEKTISAGFTISPAILHPNIRVSKSNRIGEGSIICENAILTVNIDIGRHVIINRGVNVSHDVNIGDFVTVSPGVNLAGNVIIEESAYLGIGSSVREKIRIGEASVVGGGAFVKDDVPARTLAAGVPALVKKNYTDA
jgi:sugar O-acyltransferase (sialic acid O-acetyltransferase NeuD family)